MLHWLNKEWGLQEFLPCTVVLTVTYMAWCLAVFHLGLVPTELLEGTGDNASQYHTDTLLWWVILFPSALVEEMFFRAPLSFVVPGLKRPFLIMLVVFGFSVAFGYVHPLRWWSVPIQGVFGLMISVMYLKFGGIRGKFVKPLLCTSVAHFAMNVMLSLIHDIFGTI